ncbi:MAG: hypothetical protein AAF415_08030 [Pseudomonadota bacterium]
MTFRSVPDFLDSAACKRLKPGVLSVVFCEEDWLIPETIAHVQAQRPAHILAIGRTGALASDAGLSIVTADLANRTARVEAMNQLIAGLQGRWMHWLNNAEFLFFPWCETRTINDLASFLKDERRRSLYTYALDLYAAKLPGAGQLEGAGLHFDAKAYHAFPQEDRRLTVFGGLGWRFEEFFPAWMQQIGRAALFLADKDVRIGRDMMFEADAYRSVSAPWHNSPTGAIMSLRRTSHLMAAPGFDDVAGKLIWEGSTPFGWHSAQLLDMGMIEPGQWF